MMRKDDFKTCKTFQGFQSKNLKTKKNKVLAIANYDIFNNYYKVSDFL